MNRDLMNGDFFVINAEEKIRATTKLLLSINLRRHVITINVFTKESPKKAEASKKMQSIKV